MVTRNLKNRTAEHAPTAEGNTQRRNLERSYDRRDVTKDDLRPVDGLEKNKKQAQKRTWRARDVGSAFPFFSPFGLPFFVNVACIC